MYSYSQYIDFIIKLRRCVMFSTDWHSLLDSNVVLMRHDVDFSVGCALRLAEVEQSLGFNSTYFFMLSSNMYNLLSRESISTVYRIKEMGHKISLHFDPTVYNGIDGFIAEREVFQATFNVVVDIVSIHRPGAFLDNNNIDLFGVKHTYQDRYFKQMHYISDSGGRDISLPVNQYCSDRKNKDLHLLIHPIWWGHESNSPTETLDDWHKQHFSFITDEIRANCRSYTG